ncbi:probable cleavage and polyadenylation specificity factor subunit 2, partial [Diaphorina citri]|uniref:Cleavage and polyadenylation specificity factor subunit 2 n=1 Tax=Diaphorina citri TaxID=121845 RepID=A0A3Q0JKY2_DIACI
VAYSLALLNNVSYNVVEFAKSQIEWMSDKLMKSFEGARNNPFHFKHVKLCHSLAELAKVWIPSPKVVLVSTPDMECGFSRDLFFQWCSSPENSIIITNRTSPGTLARDLIELGGNRTLTLQVKKRIRLEGEELEEYQKKKDKEAKDKQEKEKEAAAVSSESEDEDLTSGGVKGKHDLLVKTFETNKQGQSRFFKSNKKQFPMFPFHETKIKYDEYGEVIRIPPHDTSFINELQLSDFKQTLQRNGIDCEFMDGVLICCRGTVAVRRADDSDSNVIVLEGCLSDEYYRVQQLLYDQYAIL